MYDVLHKVENNFDVCSKNKLLGAHRWIIRLVVPSKGGSVGQTDKVGRELQWNEAPTVRGRQVQSFGLYIKRTGTRPLQK